MRTSRWIVLIAAAAAACSKSSSSSATDTTTAQAGQSSVAAQSVCDIATIDEMSTAIGQPVTSADAVNENHCIFKSKDALVYADVEIDRANGPAAFQGVSSGDSTIGASENSVMDVGDKAFYGPRDRLYVLKGNAFAAIEGGFDSDARARAKRVAQLVAGKL